MPMRSTLHTTLGLSSAPYASASCRDECCQQTRGSGETRSNGLPCGPSTVGGCTWRTCSLLLCSDASFSATSLGSEPTRTGRLPMCCCPMLHPSRARAACAVLLEPCKLLALLLMLVLVRTRVCFRVRPLSLVASLVGHWTGLGPLRLQVLHVCLLTVLQGGILGCMHVPLRVAADCSYCRARGLLAGLHEEGWNRWRGREGGRLCGRWCGCVTCFAIAFVLPHVGIGGTFQQLALVGS